jgi:hypothetical protein
VKAKLKEPAMRTSHQNTPETISTIGIDVRKNTFWCKFAAVAPLVPVLRRASAFGTFTAGYGNVLVHWKGDDRHHLRRFAASGHCFCMLTQIAAVPIFVWVGHRK